MEKDIKSKVIAKSLELLRDAISNGQSKYQIAKEAGMNEATIGNYVNGKTTPTFSNAKMIIEHFDPSYFISYHHNDFSAYAKNTYADSNYSQRFLQIVDILENSNPGIYDELGLEKTLKSKIRTGKQKASIEKIYNLCNKYPQVNADYIMSGKGDMLNSSAKFDSAYLREGLVSVRYVPASAAASFVESLYDVDYEKDYYSVMPEEGEVLDENYLVFQVSGDSMEPTIPDGAKILAKKIDEGFWESASGVVVIVYGKILSVKRILKNSLYLNNMLILKADNPKHGQMDVERSEIRGMWQAIRIISQKIV